MKVEGFDGIEKIITGFIRMDKNVGKVMSKGLYEGAGVVADEIKGRIEALPIQERKRTGYAPWITGKGDYDELKGITSYQKQGLIDGFGIAKFSHGGDSVETTIGFDGYNERGEPNQLIARSIESGSSVRRKNPFVRPGFNASKGRAEKAIEKTIVFNWAEMIKNDFG